MDELVDDNCKLNELGKVSSGGMQPDGYLVTGAAPSDSLVFVRRGVILYLRTVNGVFVLTALQSFDSC